MLKKIRVILSLLLFSLITLYFLDFREFLPESFSFLAKIQFIPALLAVNVLILASLLLLTLLFGRVYCSSICPMGVYQDMVAWLSKRFNRKKVYLQQSKKHPPLEYPGCYGCGVHFWICFSGGSARSLRSLRKNDHPSAAPGLSRREQFTGNHFYLLQ